MIKEIGAAGKKNPMKNIIVACDTFLTGGAETFALRMARYYKEKGHTVFLFAVLGDQVDSKLVKENAGDITVLSYNPPKFLNWLLYKFDGLFYKLGKLKTFRRRLTIDKCKKVIKLHNIDVVHTNMFGALDVFNHALLDNTSTVSVHSVHADILSLAYAEVADKKQALSRYDYYSTDNLLPNILSRVNYVVATAEMHLKIFKNWKRLSTHKLRKIYNPVDRKEEQSQSFTKMDLNIPENGFVFGSMARCIREKGWEELIQAFLKINIANTYLILIGDGSFLSELKEKYGSNTNILFVGNQPSPLKYLKLFDVGISSSYFWESLPTAIIDYMSIGKPVICTDNAESRYMIASENGPAGLTVPLIKDEWDVITGNKPLQVDDMAKAMRDMYQNHENRVVYAQNGLVCFKKFDKENIVTQYTTLFEMED